MLKTLRLFLYMNKTKPVFRIPISDTQISCLLDSGAEIPIWCGSRTKFHELFPNAAILEKKALLYGVINYKVTTIDDNVLELEHNSDTYVMYLKDSPEYVRSTYTKELKVKTKV